MVNPDLAADLAVSELQKPLSWPERQGKLFQERLAQWLELRGQLARFNLTEPKDDDDERHDELTQRLEDAARLAITTHVPLPWMVWQKIQILEDALHGTGECEWTDNRQVWMLASIKADLMAHGIGRARLEPRGAER